jgi:hypothetical protein
MPGTTGQQQQEQTEKWRLETHWRTLRRSDSFGQSSARKQSHTNASVRVWKRPFQKKYYQKPQVFSVISDDIGVARHRIPEAEKISGGLSNELMDAPQGWESFIRDKDVASQQVISERRSNSRIEL